MRVIPTLRREVVTNDILLDSLQRFVCLVVEMPKRKNHVKMVCVRMGTDETIMWNVPYKDLKYFIDILEI